MKFELYSYRDQLNGFGPIVLESNERTAVRGFSMAINNGNGLMGFSPKDYDLFLVGEFDIEKGIVMPASPGPKLVVNGLSVFNDGKGE